MEIQQLIDAGCFDFISNRGSSTVALHVLDVVDTPAGHVIGSGHGPDLSFAAGCGEP